MEQITLKPLSHRGQECIGIYFERNIKIQSVLQNKADAKWSTTRGCWYVSCTEEKYGLIKMHLKDIAVLKAQELREYLLHGSAQATIPPSSAETKKAAQKKTGTVNKKAKTCFLSDENKEALRLFKQQMVLRGFSENTIETYLNEFRQFLYLIKENSAASFTVGRLRDYFQYCHTELKLSENTIHSRLNALKFYYEQVLSREKFFWEIPRPRKPLQLPSFFSREEIASIINSSSNLKHKAMLMLAYSAGLRVSEVVSLKTFHIDSKRMSILLKGAKGKKDRMVPLSPVILILLREYCKKYKPKIDGYLFQGQYSGNRYSARSLQQVLTNTKAKAKVIKPGNIHALRHSFATHLLDKGTDVTIIMKLLGHNDLKTTLRYLHVSNRDMLQIISPLDDLKLL